MFLKNLGFAPALGPVELDDDRTAVFQVHLVDTVFIGVEAGEPAIAVQADTGTDNWQEANPFLFHVSRSAEVSKLGAFEAMANAAVDAILETYKAENGKAEDRKEAGSA